ncbi:hypothetical protein C8J57DRAFT_1713199 [Mycena rebaudengoi]|nr:hypothetical protein C8J57DRAFT_1713199 [Mycena rebaudengoi]
MLRVQPLLEIGSFLGNVHAFLPWRIPLWSHCYGTAKTRRREQGSKLRREISSLDPALLQPADFVDMSHHSSFAVSFIYSGAGDGSPLTYAQLEAKKKPFPVDSRGFLYYHSDPNHSPLAGSVRLRTTTDNAPSSFDHGQDLLTPAGMPWKITVPQIAARKMYARLCDQLLREGMVTDALLSRSRTIFGDRSNTHPDLTVFGLHHPFLVNFQMSLCLAIVGPTAVHAVQLKVFAEWVVSRTRRQRLFPFTGTGVACFERSTLPEHANKYVLVLRILKILEPVTCTIQDYTGRVGWPKEGELLMVSNRNGPQRPWSYDVDRNTLTGAALRNLIDTWQYLGSDCPSAIDFNDDDDCI